MFDVTISKTISAYQIGNTICAGIEAPNEWLHKVTAEGELPGWYGTQTFYENPEFQFTMIMDDPEGDGTKTITITPIEMQIALQQFADKYPTDFHDMVAGNEDATTGDNLLQILAYGEVVYG